MPGRCGSDGSQGRFAGRVCLADTIRCPSSHGVKLIRSKIAGSLRRSIRRFDCELPTGLAEGLLPLPGSLDDRDVAVERELGKALERPAGLRPLDFQPVDFRSRTQPEHHPRIV
jgi:hypothetical protein